MFKDILKQFFVYGAGSIAQTALNFILLPLYLHFFEPTEYGVISLLVVVISLLTLFTSMGFVNGLIRLYYGAKPGEREKLTCTTWLWYLVGGTVGGVILFRQANWFSLLLFHTGDYLYPVKLLSIFFFFSMLLIVPFYILRLEKKAGLYVGFSLFRFVIDFTLKLYFIAFLKRGIGGYFESGIIAYIIVFLLMFPFVLKYVKFSFDALYFKQLFRLGMPYIFSGIAIWTLTASDRLILNYFYGKAVVGIYSLAYGFAKLFVILLSTPITLLIDPFFFSFTAERSVEDTKRLLQKSLSYFFIVGGILYLTISLGSGDAMRILTSIFAVKKEYWEAAKLVPLLTLAPFFYFLCSQAGLVGLLVKKPELISSVCCIAAIVNVGLNFLFIPRWGAFGAAMATVIAYALIAGLLYCWTEKIWPVNYNWKELAKVVFSLAIAFIIGWQIVINQPWASLFAKVITGVAVFVLFTWFGSNILTKTEKDRFLVYLIDGRKKLATVLLRKS